MTRCSILTRMSSLSAWRVARPATERYLLKLRCAKQRTEGWKQQGKEMGRGGWGGERNIVGQQSLLASENPLIAHPMWARQDDMMATCVKRGR